MKNVSAAVTAAFTAELGAGLLVGWAAISRNMHLSPRQLRTYARTGGLPVARVGRHVVTDPVLIRTWLLEYEARRPQRRRVRAAYPIR